MKFLHFLMTYNNEIAVVRFFTSIAIAHSLWGRFYGPKWHKNIFRNYRYIYYNIFRNKNRMGISYSTWPKRGRLFLFEKSVPLWENVLFVDLLWSPKFVLFYEEYLDFSWLRIFYLNCFPRCCFIWLKYSSIWYILYIRTD